MTRTSMVTGAAGSIGSEIARQELAAGHRVVILDQAETPLYFLQRELVGCPSILASVRDPAIMVEAVMRSRPDVIFHAAALKNVFMVDDAICEAILTNVGGTLSVIAAATRVDARVVLVSTDKAVNPTTVMGATKRVAELVALTCGYDVKIVRLLNVRGSHGSVIPIFEKQIADGGPVTVSVPEAMRYMMRVEDAAALAIRASIGRETMITPDKGEEITIQSLAEQMIAASGKRIEIKYTGLSAGEKLREEIVSQNEIAEWVGEFVSVIPRVLPTSSVMEYGLAALMESANAGDAQSAKRRLFNLARL